VKVRKSLILLTISGVVIGLIFVVTQLIPLLTQQQLMVTWTLEAENYRKEKWMIKVYIMSGVPSEQALTVVGEAVANAEELANQTDHVVHLIDLRLGMALVWWEQSQSGGQFPGRYCWGNRNRLVEPVAWERLRAVEGLADVPIEVDWSLEAVHYYYDPGDPYFDVPDQPDCMIEVLQSASGGNATEFAYMLANVTVKAEELANATDKIVHVDDLREAIATILYEWGKYPSIDEARTGLAALEQEAGCGS
jgi:hypothetical protein